MGLFFGQSPASAKTFYQTTDARKTCCIDKSYIPVATFKSLLYRITDSGEKELAGDVSGLRSQLGQLGFDAQDFALNVGSSVTTSIMVRSS